MPGVDPIPRSPRRIRNGRGSGAAGGSIRGLLTVPALAATFYVSADNPDGQREPAPSPAIIHAPLAAPGSAAALHQLPTEPLLTSRDQARRINAQVPFAMAPNPPAAPFRFTGDAASRERAIDCLASAQYYEAGADPAGQRAVAQVVLNRVRHPAYPSTVCGVVYQGAERASGCQFTFTCDGAMARRPLPWLWQQARTIARQALDGQVCAQVGQATHYHTDWVVPAWSGRLDKVVRVQTHLFFRWRGAWGLPRAFAKAPSAIEPLVPKLAALSRWHDPAGYGETAKSALVPVTDRPFSVSQAAPAAVRLAGIDLRGSELRLVHPEGDAFGFLLPSSRPGAFGLLAFDVCRGRAFCKVMGWTDAAAIPAGFPVPFAARQRMAFLYVHDRARHAEIIAWDCGLFPRSDAAECLGNRLTRWDATLALDIPTGG